MNAERLIAHYERIADAPEAIVRLRRFILDLAVRGKLVPQEPNEPLAKRYSDEPSSDDLPSNWRLLNFGKFCDIEGGDQPPKSQFINEAKKGYVHLLQIRDLGERPVPTFIPIGSTNRFARRRNTDRALWCVRWKDILGSRWRIQRRAYEVYLAGRRLRCIICILASQVRVFPGTRVWCNTIRSSRLQQGRSSRDQLSPPAAL